MPKLNDNQKLLFTQLIALVFIFIGFYFIDNTRKSSYETDIWHVVASEAIALVEVEHPSELLSVKDSSSFFNAVKGLGGGKQSDKVLSKFLILLDSAVQNPTLGVKGNVYFSLNSTGSQPTSWSFYIPTEERFYIDYFQQLKSLPNKRFNRKYKGVEVQEFELNGSLLSVAKIRNFIVASTDALWIEEAIRNDGERFYDEYYFQTLNQNFKEYNTSLADGVNVWIRSNAVVDWFESMNNLGVTHPFPSLMDYTFGLKLFECTEKKNEVSIKAHNTLDPNSFLSYVDQTLSSSKDLAHRLMTDDIAFYERWNVNDVDGFIKSSQAYSIKNNPTFLQQKNKLFDTNGIDPTLITHHLKGDFVKAIVPSVTGRDWSNIYFFQVNDQIGIDKDLIDLKRAYEKSNQQKAEIIGRNGFSILRLKVNNLTGMVFGQKFDANSEATYLVRVDKFLVVATDLPILSKWLNDWLIKRRWSKQKRFQELVTKLNSLQSKASFVMNTTASWSSMMNSFSKPYQKYLTRYRQLLLSLNFQVWSYNNKEFEWTALFSGDLKEGKTKSTELLFSRETGVDLKYPPFLFNNEMGNPEGFALIDKENILEAYNFTGDTVFYQEFDSLLSSKPELIWDTEHKASLFVSQNNKVLHLNREAQYFNDFPVQLPDVSQIEYLKWLPWHADGSKEFYQNTEGVVLAVDTLGNIYGIDLDGQLKGKWQPVNTLHRLCMPPFVFESNAKKYVITLSSEGKLILFDHKGNYMKGFPKLFKKKVSPKLFVEEDATLGDTKIAFISKIGQIVELNAEGEVLKNEMLGDRASNRRFQLLIDEARNRNYLILNQRYGHLQVMNSGGQQLFTKQFKENSLVIGQYFDFGVDAEIVVITFPKEQKAYLFYSNGQPFISSPISNDKEVEIIYKPELQQFILVSSVDNKTEIRTIDRRN
ncbi:hypothetical protein KMW28_16275 [Flammeovirga yaeyamensis]|uniref:Uncharacterized protein n=1 Tax=Flammeovirga yaeyamensis TaxID=367791 RepID=A0AAX1N5R3_9BACT|nr:hypothetical protein [Flammeovirga yaeyamensis]MBB3698432.1 hypothetical protein [Flammeovirga yaeyamensis]NMF34218.1 hypothetical protein [Flammeovirga yaeyamensis]QWG01203.1 hypothetical protein KMW28_16275 [Flammeovirga yaeyamensis]